MINLIINNEIIEDTDLMNTKKDGWAYYRTTGKSTVIMTFEEKEDALKTKLFKFIEENFSA